MLMIQMGRKLRANLERKKDSETPKAEKDGYQIQMDQGTDGKMLTVTFGVQRDKVVRLMAAHTGMCKHLVAVIEMSGQVAVDHEIHSNH
jgi:hypothetical protein